MQREDPERIWINRLTQTIISMPPGEDRFGDWVAYTLAEKAEAEAQRSACEAVSALGQAHEAQRNAEAEWDAAFATGQDAERERCWTLTMDAYEVWWRRSVATAYDPLQKLADKIGRPIKPRP